MTTNEYISTVGHWTESASTKWSIESLIGGIVGGGIILLIVVCIVLGVLIHRKKRNSVAGRSSPTASEFLKSSSSKGTLLSYLHLDVRRKLNLFAFKRQESARAKPRPASGGGEAEERHQEVTPPCPDNPKAGIAVQDCIKMKANLSYSTLSCCTENDAAASNVEYGYDVPLSEIVVQPFEYEMPLETSVQMQNDYETIPDPDEDRIYEEIS